MPTIVTLGARRGEPQAKRFAFVVSELLDLMCDGPSTWDVSDAGENAVMWRLHVPADYQRDACKVMDALGALFQMTVIDETTGDSIPDHFRGDGSLGDEAEPQA